MIITQEEVAVMEELELLRIKSAIEAKCEGSLIGDILTGEHGSPMYFCVTGGFEYIQYEAVSYKVDKLVAIYEQVKFTGLKAKVFYLKEDILYSLDLTSNIPKGSKLIADADSDSTLCLMIPLSLFTEVKLTSDDSEAVAQIKKAFTGSVKEDSISKDELREGAAYTMKIMGKAQTWKVIVLGNELVFQGGAKRPLSKIPEGAEFYID